MRNRNSVVIEEYLLVIYSLRSDEKPIKAVQLTKRLRNSPSTVHATLSRMRRDKLISIGKKKDITLTAEGLVKAEQLTRRHRLVETFLCETLGISWHEVHEHAHILEHGLTPLVEEKLAAFLNFPKSCPHGTPFPGEEKRIMRETIALNDANPEDTVEVVYVNESLEESVELMKFLQEKNFRPGSRHKVVEKTDITKTIVLAANDHTTTLSFDIAEKIGVLKLPSNPL